MDEVFPQGEFFGSEIVITGFLNSVDNVPLLLANVRRLAKVERWGSWSFM